MNGRIRWAMRLYPRAWRERYGAEFEALLEQTGLGWRDSWNVVNGALAMRVRSIRARRLVAISGVLSLAIAAAVFASVTAPKPQVTLDFRSESGRQSQGIDSAIGAAANRFLSERNLVRLIESHGLYPRERAKVAMGTLAAVMRRGIEIRSSATSGGARRWYEISFAYPDSAAAMQVESDLSQALLEAVFQCPTAPTSAMMDISAPLPTIEAGIESLLLACLLFGLLAGAIKLASGRFKTV